MKKIICVSLIASFASLFAISYKNNTYQRLADEYNLKAQRAFDVGQYEDAVDYSAKAEENAALSRSYIDMMKTRGDAETQMKLAKSRIDWAKSIGAERTYPMAFTSASENYTRAENSFNGEDYASASSYARESIKALDGIVEVVPLPEFYIVRPWRESRDCFWNISGRPYVYNNPLLWENLYQANKSSLPHPEDPNIILPGMKMKIPSLTGEYREGVYSPKKKYTPYGSK